LPPPSTNVSRHEIGFQPLPASLPSTIEFSSTTPPPPVVAPANATGPGAALRAIVALQIQAARHARRLIGDGVAEHAAALDQHRPDAVVRDAEEPAAIGVCAIVGERDAAQRHVLVVAVEVDAAAIAAIAAIAGIAAAAARDVVLDHGGVDGEVGEQRAERAAVGRAVAAEDAARDRDRTDADAVDRAARDVLARCGAVVVQERRRDHAQAAAAHPDRAPTALGVATADVAAIAAREGEPLHGQRRRAEFEARWHREDPRRAAAVERYESGSVEHGVAGHVLRGRHRNRHRRAAAREHDDAADREGGRE
jgi:hypothetical protein